MEEERNKDIDILKNKKWHNVNFISNIKCEWIKPSNQKQRFTDG